MKSTYPDRLIQLDLFFVILIRVEGVKTNIVMYEFVPDLYFVLAFVRFALTQLKRCKTHLQLECIPLFQSKAVRLSNDRYDVDNFAQLLHHNHINRLEGVTSRVDEVYAAVNARVLNVSVTHGSQLFAKVSRVLVFDVFDDRIPAAFEQKIVRENLFQRQGTVGDAPIFVVDLISISRCVDDVQPQLHAIFDNDYKDTKKKVSPSFLPNFINAVKT
jgi:hypothetical protein